MATLKIMGENEMTIYQLFAFIVICMTMVAVGYSLPRPQNIVILCMEMQYTPEECREYNEIL